MNIQYFYLTFEIFRSAAYLHSFRETSQQRLNTMRVQTMSSLRNPGHLMRAGMNILTTQVNSLRDYCGVTAGHPLPSEYVIQQQRLHHLQHSPGPVLYLRPNQISTIVEEDENMVESASMLNEFYRTPYVGQMSTNVPLNASGIGLLDAADNSALLALDNFHTSSPHRIIDSDNLAARGQMSAGIGTFHDYVADADDDLINEPERLTIYGNQRSTC